MRIGLLGGTFNPIHIGHLVLAQELWHQLVLDKVVFIPAFMPPHKNVGEDASPLDRLNMVRLASEGDRRFEVSTYEIDRGGKSYSIDTIKHFRAKYGEDADLFFLAGADSAESLSMWKDTDEILKLVQFVIASRPGWGMDSPYKKKIKYVTIPNMEVSSTGIRERIRASKPIDYLVPSRVVEYVRNKGLYKE